MPIMMGPHPASVASRTLTCWKDIAGYLGKAVRTAQRWERELGLPVRRPEGTDHKYAIIAHTRDLDAWMRTRWLTRADRNSGASTDGSSLISAAKTLRIVHQMLMEDNSTALAKLIETCNQLDESRRLTGSLPVNKSLMWKTPWDA
jgi:hypothetical protein